MERDTALTSLELQKYRPISSTHKNDFAFNQLGRDRI